MCVCAFRMPWVPMCVCAFKMPWVPMCVFRMVLLDIKFCLTNSLFLCGVHLRVRYEYHWCDGVNYKKPTALPAPQYIALLMEWVESQINDESLFPVQIGQSQASLTTDCTVSHRIIPALCIISPLECLGRKTHSSVESVPFQGLNQWHCGCGDTSRMAKLFLLENNTLANILNVPRKNVIITD